MMLGKGRTVWGFTISMLVGLFLFGVQPVRGDLPPEKEPPWSAPTQISVNADRMGNSWFPAIVVDYQGHPHVFYYGGKDERDCVMYTTLNAGRWSAPVDVVSPGRGGYTVRLSVALDRFGNVQLLFRAGTEIDQTQSPLSAAGRPQSWAAAHRISGSGAAYYPDMAVDISDTIHVVWNETVQDVPNETNPICLNCMDIFYRRSVDGGRTWSSPLNLSRSPGGSNRPQIRLGEHGIVYVVWEEAVDYTGNGQAMGIAVRRSPDGGRTWEPIYHVINEGAPDASAATPEPQPQGTATPMPMADFVSTHAEWFSPTISIPGAGMPIQPTLVANSGAMDALLVWRTTEGDRFYYQLLQDDAVWSAPQEIPGFRTRLFQDTPYDTYDIAKDSLGRAHLLAVGNLPGAAASRTGLPRGLYELVFDGISWSVPAQISLREGFLPEWPQLAVGLGNELHAVWFERSFEEMYRSESAHYDVWYSSRSTRAPSVVASLWLTPTPTVTPTTGLLLQRMNTPTAVLGRLDSQHLDKRVYSEATYVLQLGLAIAPVLLLVIILGGKWVRRQ